MPIPGPTADPEAPIAAGFAPSERPDSQDAFCALTEIHVIDVAASIAASLAKRQPGTVELDRLDLAQVQLDGPSTGVLQKRPSTGLLERDAMSVPPPLGPVTTSHRPSFFSNHDCRVGLHRVNRGSFNSLLRGAGGSTASRVVGSVRRSCTLACA